jgi:DNA (cytosine-5)-methyltransferase 1
MKVLNLYSGIGGNRKLWEDVEVTAVEINPSIAEIYKDLFPDDIIIVADAHGYLEKHHNKFDFIWSSPPCPTHSRINYLMKAKGQKKMVYPDLKLYEEIIFLDNWFDGLWIVENVKSYYSPLILPQETARHYFWANFKISDFGISKKVRNDKGMTLDIKMKEKGIFVNDFHNYKGDKRTLLNNAIEPELGKHILNCAMNNVQPQEYTLFFNHQNQER